MWMGVVAVDHLQLDQNALNLGKEKTFIDIPAGAALIIRDMNPLALGSTGRVRRSISSSLSGSMEDAWEDEDDSPSFEESSHGRSNTSTPQLCKRPTCIGFVRYQNGRLKVKVKLKVLLLMRLPLKVWRVVGIPSISRCRTVRGTVVRRHWLEIALEFRGRLRFPRSVGHVCKGMSEEHDERKRDIRPESSGKLRFGGFLNLLLTFCIALTTSGVGLLPLGSRSTHSNPMVVQRTHGRSLPHLTFRVWQ